MKTIFKYVLETTDRQTVAMPKGAEPLALQVQRGVPCLWALVDDRKELAPQAVFIVGTGHPAPDEATAGSYLGNYQLHDGALIFHVFAPGMGGSKVPD